MTCRKIVFAAAAALLLWDGPAYSQVFDLAVESLTLQGDRAAVGRTLLPSAEVVNHGPDSSPPFLLIWQIFSADSQIVYGPVFEELPGLAAGADSRRVFAPPEPWIPQWPGSYFVELAIQAEGDGDPGNNQQQLNVQIAPAMLSRQQAIALIEENVLAQNPHADQLVGFFYNYNAAAPDSLLHPGSVVMPWDSAFVEEITDDTYFFWFDYFPNEEWLHPAGFAFVNAWTGEYFLLEAQGWPIIDGVEWTQMMEDGDDSPDKVHGSYGKAAPRISYTPVQTANDSDWVVIVVGRNLHGKREKGARINDIARIQECLNGVRRGPQITGKNIVTVTGTDTLGATPEEVLAKLDSLKKRACRKLYFYYIGHGRPGAMLLKKAGTKATAPYTYRKLAQKLLEMGVPEVCIIIEACYSGSAIRQLKRARIRKGKKKTGLKGIIITSSTSGNTTTRHPDGAPFNKALLACCKDPEADLNEDGRITLIEAVAWARAKNDIVNRDKPQGAVLGDGRSIVFLPPRIVTSFNSKFSNKFSQALKYEVSRVCYKIKKGASGGKKDSLVCRYFLYVRNMTRLKHTGINQVDVVCLLGSKKRTRRVVRTYRPILGPLQRICLLRLPADCKKVIVQPHKAQTTISSLAQVAGRPLAEERGAIYRPGEFIFQELEIPDDSLNQFMAFADPLPGWELTLSPRQFITTALIDTEYVFLRGFVPDTARYGAALNVTLINTTAEDTATFDIDAMLYDSLGTDISDNRRLFYQFFDLAADVHAVQDTVAIESSVVQFIAPDRAVIVDENGALRLANALFRPDSGAGYRTQIHGALVAHSASFNESENGLWIADATVDFSNVNVLLSQADGVHFSGDFSASHLDFLFIDLSSGYGMHFDGATHVIITNSRIENSGLGDVLVENQSQVRLVNCEYDSSKEAVRDSSSLERVWTVALALMDGQGRPVAGAEVEIFDADGARVFQTVTDSSGFVGPADLTAYLARAGKRIWKTPHRISIRAAGQDTSFALQIDRQIAEAIPLSPRLTAADRRRSDLPSRFTLLQNYPNPFGARLGRRQTTVVYALDRESEVTVSLYNVLGQKVRQKKLGLQAAGLHRFQFDSAGLVSGIYFYEISTPHKRLRRKMLIVQ